MSTFAIPIKGGANGGIAQLARAPALQAGGRRFESVYLHPMAVTQCDCLFCYYPLFNIFERQKNHIVPNK